ncbi:MAG: hydrogenase maturation protease [Candidatus Methanomethylicaceae archaeon]|jgi:hydrogenase 3 maturation protease
MEEDSIERELRNWLRGARRIVIAGIGNPLRRDDYVGMRIVLDLMDVASQRVYLVGCETTPESHSQEILEFKPTHILVIDATSLGRPGGSIAFLEDLKSAPPPMTMHTLPLQILCGYLRSTSGAKVALLAIQPQTIDFGEGLTREVENSAMAMVRTLRKILSPKKKY